MKRKIGISAWGSCSALGHSSEAIWQAYTEVDQTAISWQDALSAWGASLPAASEEAVLALQQSAKAYHRLDRSVLLAMLAAAQAVEKAHWLDRKNIGLLLGSSRGATTVWEQSHAHFLKGEALTPQVSPLTTAGNLATHTAQHLGLTGLVNDSSITCSTALHAIVNAVAWLESGRYDRFLAGGTEAPLTPFTLAQMRALKIYAADTASDYPCRALDVAKTHNTMVLGEGSALFCLAADTEAAVAFIKGIGFARETTPTLTAVSKEGDGIRQAMQKAWEEAEQVRIDAIVCHSPGTVLGDQSELNAVGHVFGDARPMLVSNKWKLGHTLGASGGLSLELALLLLQHQQSIPVPYLSPTPAPEKIEHVMVNALGFGGNAVSIVLGLK